MPISGSLDRLVYIDDSGSVDHGGLIVYGWVEVAPQYWSDALAIWLDLRTRLYRDFGVHGASELHSTEYINGRRQIADPRRVPNRFKNGTQILKKDFGRAVAAECLSTMAGCEPVRVGAVYHWSEHSGPAYAQDRYDLYAALVERFESELKDADSLAIVAMDGNDPHYREVHRGLPASRRIIEDPWYQDSHRSPFTQMADLVAYTANIHLNRYPGNAFGHGWYDAHLLGKAGDTPPQELAPKQLDPLST